MIEKCFFSLVVLSVVFAAFTGNMGAVANAALDGAANAVTVVISLCGAMCLWNGIMEVLRESGAIRVLSRLLSPVLRHVFPKTWQSGAGRDEVCAALSANILGIGNAATPLALSAMEKMNAACTGGVASDDMVTFAALGAASLDLLPTTLIALRRGAGSLDPFNIIVPIWICSASCAFLTVVLCRLCAAASSLHEKKKKARIQSKTGRFSPSAGTAESSAYAENRSSPSDEPALPQKIVGCSAASGSIRTAKAGAFAGYASSANNSPHLTAPRGAVSPGARCGAASPPQKGGGKCPSGTRRQYADN